MLGQTIMRLATVLLSAAACSAALREPADRLAWTLSPTNSTQQFRGLSPVTNLVVWVSGTMGTVLRTTDGGLSWVNVSPSFSSENASSFQFRDIQAWSETTAVVLSIGQGNASRIYRTDDGGKSWNRAFVNEEATAFYDCMAFEKEKPKHGVAMSDPVNGRFRLLETWNGGKSWDIRSSQNMPAALEGEAGFAASGTCIEAMAGRWYIATGGVNPGRIFRSSNLLGGWQVTNSPIAGGAAAGVFSVRFRDTRNGIALGGDFEKPTANVDVAAWSKDGGMSWQRAKSFPGGYRSGASWIPGRGNTAVAVGTSGSDITFDAGRNWRRIDNSTFDAVECTSKNVCWASGSGGRVGRLSV
ncbi:hypothetical protein J1614_008496 [Plenodomus biglobosus]|nr:hypothetical protein J1614_008496 [Plenodomus biglobosus]